MSVRVGWASLVGGWVNVQAANERLLRARRVARTMVGVCRRIILGGFLIEDANGNLSSLTVPGP